MEVSGAGGMEAESEPSQLQCGLHALGAPGRDTSRRACRGKCQSESISYGRGYFC
jgi:hypothetical protein